MQIPWTNCADQMPPDGGILIIVKLSYIKQGVDYVCCGRICDYVAITSSAFLDEIRRYARAESKHWTPFTPGKWEYLNK